MNKKRWFSNILAGVGTVAGAGALAFVPYYWSEMNREISQLWENRDHINNIFNWVLEFSLAGPFAAWFNDKRSPVDEQPPPQPQPKPPVAPQQQVAGPEFELSQPIPKVVRPQPDISLEPAKNYFSEAELDCKGIDCQCKFPGMNKRIMEIANAAREELGPLFVNSAYRCPVYNEKVGGVRNSKHVLAMALDLRSPTRSADELYTYFDQKYPDTLGLGLYDKFIHVDSRIEMARWDNRTAAMVP